jgi:glycosyltransferase involved in cell wall biosynthesis
MLEMSPVSERSRNVPVPDNERVMRTLVAQVWAKEQTLRQFQLRLAERERELESVQHELDLIVNSRRYQWMERLRTIYQWLRHARGALRPLTKKALALRPGEGSRQRAKRTTDRTPEARSPSLTASRSVPAAHFALPPSAADNRVCIVVHQFFNQNGENMFYGGAERYLIELERLIRDLGYEPEVYQSGAGDWVRYYNDLRVIGLDTGGDQSRLNEVFHARVPPGALTIYLAFSLLAPCCHPRSIGISHGIYWDRDDPQVTKIAREHERSAILEAFDHATTMVSVDTSTINWVRGTRIDLAPKFLYIPNFVDTQEFRPSPEPKTPGRLVVLYPRRLYRPRGFWLLRLVLPDLIERFPFVDFHFVGKADRAEEAEVRSLMERNPGRVQWYFLPPERMSEAYRVADITVIPTVHSEGTSLSCLEAQASGNAVIATTVGGLPDLVLHEFNGLLIEPRADFLHEALVRLLADDELRRRLGRQASDVAQTFSLNRWREQWAIVLAQCAIPPADWASSGHRSPTLTTVAASTARA